jgi:hypothetical protein
MNRDLIDKALLVAFRMAADRGVKVGRDALMTALVAVAGEGNGQDEPEEVAKEALELLGESPAPTSSRSGRRPF